MNSNGNKKGGQARFSQQVVSLFFSRREGVDGEGGGSIPSREASLFPSPGRASAMRPSVNPFWFFSRARCRDSGTTGKTDDATTDFRDGTDKS